MLRWKRKVSGIKREGDGFPGRYEYTYPHTHTQTTGALAISSSSINKGVKDKENDGRLGNASTKAGGGGVSAVNSSSRPSRLATLLSEAK